MNDDGVAASPLLPETAPQDGGAGVSISIRLTVCRSTEFNGTLGLASALDEFWRMVNAAEGWNWLQRLLQDVLEDNPNRQRALLMVGPLAAQVAAYAEGTELLQAAVGLAHEIEDGWGGGFAHMILSMCAADANDLERTRRHGRAALNTPSLGPLLVGQLC